MRLPVPSWYTLLSYVNKICFHFLLPGLLENNGFARIVAAVFPSFKYAFALLMMVSFYRLIVFLYNYVISMHIHSERLKSRLREVKQQCKEKKRSLKEMLDQLTESLDPEENEGIEEL